VTIYATQCHDLLHHKARVFMPARTYSCSWNSLAIDKMQEVAIPGNPW